MDRSYGVRFKELNTWDSVRLFPSRLITTSYMMIGFSICEGQKSRLTSGKRFIFDLMNRRRCFWFMQDELK